VSAEDLAKELAATLVSAGVTLAAAESCTGGLAAAAITGVPGASSFFLGSFVSYSNQAKESMLGVSADCLNRYGAVSEETGTAMAAGAAAALGADCAFSITGIAGPLGGTSDKPVGTVWFGFAICGSTFAESCHFDGDRAAIRDSSVRYALGRIIELIRQCDRA
jgi:PncC family amidohydrolase